jgi:hypothetical protein
MSDPAEGALAAVIVGLVVMAALVFGAWQLGWIFTEANAKREGKLETIHAHNLRLRNGYEYQLTLRGEITTDIQGIIQIASQMVGQPAAEQEALANQRQSRSPTSYPTPSSRCVITLNRWKTAAVTSS